MLIFPGKEMLLLFLSSRSFPISNTPGLTSRIAGVKGGASSAWRMDAAASQRAKG